MHYTHAVIKQYKTHRERHREFDLYRPDVITREKKYVKFRGEHHGRWSS